VPGDNSAADLKKKPKSPHQIEALVKKGAAQMAN
jgi:hypothetical protein